MKKSLNRIFTKSQIFFEYIAFELENIKIFGKLFLNNKKKDSRKFLEVSAKYPINDNTVVKYYLFDQIYKINLFKNIINQMYLPEFESKEINLVRKTFIKIILNLKPNIINKSTIYFLREI